MSLFSCIYQQPWVDSFILLEDYRACFLAEIVTLLRSFVCLSSENNFLLVFNTPD